MKKIRIPDYVEEALGTIKKRGYEAYIVGGAVRDALLGREPFDWDIATNAKTADIKAMFPRHADTGGRHGTITAIVRGAPVEITTYRTEGEYKDFRRPERVFFTDRLKDDLLRRDFTVNAFAYNTNSGLVDVCGSLQDLRHGIIRCIGNPDTRFNEDALRVLRALRFCVTLNFEIETKTYDAICRNAHLLSNISRERISEELTRILMADKGIELLFETGVGKVILPEVAQCFSVWQNSPKHIYDVGNHSLETVYNVPKTPVLRYAALLHDVGKADTKTTDKWGFDCFPNHAKVSAGIAREVLTRLRISSKWKKEIVTLIKLHAKRIKPVPIDVRRAVAGMGREQFAALLLLKRGDIMAQSPRYAQEQLAQLDQIEAIYLKDVEGKVPLSLKELAVDGSDLKQLGLQGREIGRMLRLLLLAVMENPRRNKRRILIRMAKNVKKKK